VARLFSFRDLPRSHVFARILFLAGILVFLLVDIIASINAVSLIHKPFAGFLINQRMVVAYLGPGHWPGVKAGLKFPDKLLKAEGRPLASLKDLNEVIAQVPIGTPITYTLQKGDRTIQVTLPTQEFNWFDLLMTYGIEFILAHIYFFLGMVVYVLKPDTPVSTVALAACLLISMMHLTSFDIESTHTGLIRPYFVFSTFMAACVLHLSLLFPEKSPWLARRPLLAAVPYLAAALIVVPIQVSYPGPLFLSLRPINLLFIAFCDLALVASTIWAFLRSSSRLARVRAKVVLFGAVLAIPLPALAPTISSLGGSIAGLPLRVLVLPVIIFPAAIVYAIVKHNLFDVDTYIKRAVGYGVMTIIVGTGYFSVQVIMRKFILEPMLGAQAENVYPIIFALLVVFFFNPVNRRVQEGVEKLFFRKQYDYKATVAAVTDALTSVVDLKETINRVIGTVRKEMFVDTAGVVLVDDRKRECRALFMGDGPPNMPEQKKELCLAYDDPLLALLAREKKLITKYDIAEDPQYEPLRESCGKRFADIGASLALPLFYRDEFTGVLALGYKKSGHFYTREDIDLLKTVSAMTSTAIEQAREKGEKQMVMQLFSKHVSPEVAEAVWNQREQFLDGGRPRSQKLIVTVLFTDLKGFSTLSEKTDPQALMDLLNTYMDTIAKCVMDHGGVVDDYFGDGMKANFGVPLPRTTEAEIRQDAVNAVDSALAMEREMIRLNARMKEQGLPPLKMRVGIYTGPVVAGSLGSTERMKYTTVGDTVNTASRLESFDKDLVLPHLETSPCRILIGESTLRCLGDQFITQKVGELSLKGKDEKIIATCVLGRAGRGAAGVIDH
jgi:class 3 adenylate cyclase